jgi:NhaP-type Na+/H+ or K+/H+ antiporter
VKIVAGGLVGALAGRALAAALHHARDRQILQVRFESFAAPAMALVAYGAAQSLGTYGFVAVFVAGLAVRRYERGHNAEQAVDDRRVHEGADVVDMLLELAVLVMLGSMVTSAALGLPGWGGWALAAAVLVLRPLLVLPVLPRGRMSRDERRFVGIFGVRGVAALYYGAVAAGAGVVAPDEMRVVFWTAAACVVVSVLVHGFGATPLMRKMLPAPQT